MNVLLFGATGMIGQAVLRECLLDARVKRVLSIGRRASDQQHEKLEEVVQPDVTDLTPIESQLGDFDACMFCLGISSVGMSEEQYSSVTHDLTLSVARTLARRNQGMTFVYVSAMGSDSTERGRVMWARVRGRTENELLRLPFDAAYMVRPALIVPQHGIKSRTTWTRIAYALSRPLLSILRKLAPEYVTTTDLLGKAMISLARNGYARPVLETSDINRAGQDI